jgi:hypothetical protein
VDRWSELFGSSFLFFFKDKMIDVGAVGISRSVRDFQTSVGAFLASIEVAASTSSSTRRQVSIMLRRETLW